MNKRKSLKKADICTERVTLVITPEQRDFLDSLTRKIAGNRSKTRENITRNTLLRAIIDCLRYVNFDYSDCWDENQVFEKLFKAIFPMNKRLMEGTR